MKYSKKPGKHALELLLERKSGKAKQLVKVKEFKKLQPFSYAYQDIDITIKSIEEDTKGLLKIETITEKHGKVLDIETDYRFQNPPLRIIDMQNYKVDAKGDLKEFLGQAINAQIK